jgi:F420-dependent oxidoreductase-like protein
MRIGVGIGGATIEDAVGGAREAAEAGFVSGWFSNIFGLDAITACAVAGREVPGIDVGTFVVPTFPRHPVALAQQAASTADACSGRFVLGIGLSHQVVIEGVLGLSFDKPARHLREYLEVLVPLLREGRVDHRGDVYTVRATLERPGDAPAELPVIVAALGPVMLGLAGRLADGTATWMTGVRTVAEHVAPRITAAADEAGRPAPRVVVGLPVCVTDDVDAARERAARNFAVYGTLPSYRAMLDREGAEGPADVAIVGDEEQVAAGIRSVFEAGGTEFNASVFGSSAERERTSALLRSLL